MEALVDLIRFADERPSLVSPIAGTWTLPTDCAAALEGVGVRPSRSSSDRTGNQAAEQRERCESDNEWGRRDSNPHWRRFKRPASAVGLRPPAGFTGVIVAHGRLG